MTAPLISVLVPIKTTNPLNGQTGNSRTAAIIRKNKRRQQRSSTAIHVRGAFAKAAVDPRVVAPCVVKLTRLSAGVMDTDGLAASAKGARDGIADVLGIDDGDPAIRFEYAQEKCKRGAYGVRVEIWALDNPQPPNSPNSPIQSAFTHTRKAIEMQSNNESLPESAIAGSRIRKGGA